MEERRGAEWGRGGGVDDVGGCVWGWGLLEGGADGRGVGDGGVGGCGAGQ